MSDPLVIAGTRPQLIKLAGIPIPFQWIDTSQHWDDNMTKDVIRGLDIPPPIKMKWDMQKIKQLEQLDFLVVWVIGDTRSTLEGAMAAVALHYPLVHIEAGARCWHPTIEEMNRITVDRLSDRRWCATPRCLKNLEEEGLDGVWTGDLLYSVFQKYKDKAIKPNLSDYNLLTLHRQETVDDPKYVMELLDRLPPCIWIRHPRCNHIYPPEHIIAIEPVGYLESLGWIKHAKHVFTDSGGIHREAMWFDKTPTILRKQREWQLNEEWKEFELP